MDYGPARQIFRLLNITHEETRTYDDIWSFCLKSRSIRFYDLSDYQNQLRMNSQALPPTVLLRIPELLQGNTKFWMVFERRPTFTDANLNCDIEAMKNTTTLTTNNAIVGRIRFFPHVQTDFSYGALTSMTTYHYHRCFHYTKRETEWTVMILFPMEERSLFFFSS